MTIAQWKSPFIDSVSPVIHLVTGERFSIDNDDLRLLGTTRRVSVLQETEGMYYERVFIAQYLVKATHRLCIPRYSVHPEERYCNKRKPSGECWCVRPHVVDHSDKVSLVNVGSLIICDGVTVYRITEISKLGAYGDFERMHEMTDD